MPESVSNAETENCPRAGNSQDKVLVSCVGFNPASVVICARHYQVSRAVLIGTRESEPQLEAVARQMQAPAARLIFDTSTPTINAVQGSVQRALGLQDDEKIVFDLTGATKLLTLGAWVAVAKHPHDRVSAVYLTAGGGLFDAISGTSIDHQAAIEIDEVLQWQGANVRKSLWHGSLLAVDAAITQRATLGNFLVRAMGGRRVKTNPRKNQVTITNGQMPARLPAGFQQHKNVLTSAIPGYFSQNQWLEELCLARAKDVLSGCRITRAAAGVDMQMTGTNANDEADVVLVRGARVCVIEAKARLSGAGAGADLQKRIAKTRQFFGSHATVIFVHPAWGADAPAELVVNTRRNAILVGSNMQHLDAAIEKALL